ncbi:MAG TPA: DUF503 domain-containing protein [Phycisphaerae bacterium]|nr:DUF503 domain-containing protein [Phycisphaerales bacterium]HNO78648.1 DUF503 domain-containing protein [Phycisphaerae bacterium]
MVLGVLTLELVIYEAQSLKDKRRVVKSLKERIRNRFNVSVSEVEHQELRQRAGLAVAMVSNDAKLVHGCFDQIVGMVERDSVASLLSFEKEIL